MDDENENASRPSRADQDARFEPVHDGAYDKIVRPDVELRVPAYFLRNWVPIVGSGPALTYLQLRQMCWYDLKNPQNSRDYCWPKQKKLAQLTGFGDRSLRRYLKTLEEHQLIRRKATYHYDRDKGKKVRGVDVYQVPFRVPLAKNHEGKAAILDAEDIAASAAKQLDEQRSDPPTGHVGHQVKDEGTYPPPTGHGGLGTARPDWPREDIPEGPNVSNVKREPRKARSPVFDLTRQQRERRDAVCFQIMQAFYDKARDRATVPTGDSYLGLYRRLVTKLGERRSYEARAITLDAFQEGRVNVASLHRYFFGVCRKIAERDRIGLEVNWRSARLA